MVEKERVIFEFKEIMCNDELYMLLKKSIKRKIMVFIRWLLNIKGKGCIKKERMIEDFL